jgi:hypothetical protein
MTKKESRTESEGYPRANAGDDFRGQIGPQSIYVFIFCVSHLNCRNRSPCQVGRPRTMRDSCPQDIGSCT